MIFRMNIHRNDLCPCGSGKKYKKCCYDRSSAAIKKTYINDSHQWMDEHLLHGRYPDLYGFLLVVDHEIPAAEIWNRLKFWTQHYLDFGVNRTSRFHEIIDEEIDRQRVCDERDGYRPPYCHKGCANCCYQPVACTDEEALLIHSYCMENNIAIDFASLERQHLFLNFDSSDNYTGETTWDDQPEEDRGCVFLDERDRTCRIWPVRPFVCRIQMAEKTDAHCRSHNGVPDPDARGILSPECSYIVSAVFTVHHDSIGKMMYRLLKQAGEQLKNRPELSPGN